MSSLLSYVVCQTYERIAWTLRLGRVGVKILLSLAIAVRERVGGRRKVEKVVGVPHGGGDTTDLGRYSREMIRGCLDSAVLSDVGVMSDGNGRPSK